MSDVVIGGEIPEEELPEIVDEQAYEGLGFTPEDVATFTKWSLGQEAEPPQVVRKMMSNLSQKLTVSLGLNITSNQRRQQTLMRNLQQMEDKLLSDEEWDSLEFDQRLKLYNEIRRTNDSLMETQRKFIAQNKELIPTQGSEQGKLMAMIMTMPPDKIEALLSFLQQDDSGVIDAESGDIEDM